MVWFCGGGWVCAVVVGSGAIMVGWCGVMGSCSGSV